MKIGLMGTRGVPAAYGGFETAVEEVGSRLVGRGHDVVVYCRSSLSTAGVGGKHLGMTRVVLPAIRRRSLETLSHSFLSGLHVLFSTKNQRPDVVILFNAANIPVLLLLALAKVPTAIHTDGLESQRSKWGPVGQRYYSLCERLAARSDRILISDAEGIRQHYLTQYSRDTVVIAYGASILAPSPPPRILDTVFAPSSYNLVVSRFERENQVLEIVAGYRGSADRRPLLLVGGEAYATGYGDAIRAVAGEDSRIRFLGPIYDQGLLDRLYAHCHLYLHGHTVGGTNPSLLRAMAAGSAVLASRNVFNEEVLGVEGGFFSSPLELTALLDGRVADSREDERAKNIRRVESQYSWDDVADDYEQLCLELSKGLRF